MTAEAYWALSLQVSFPSLVPESAHVARACLRRCPWGCIKCPPSSLYMIVVVFLDSGFTIIARLEARDISLRILYIVVQLGASWVGVDSIGRWTIVSCDWLTDALSVSQRGLSSLCAGLCRVWPYSPLITTTVCICLSKWIQFIQLIPIDC